MGCKAAAAAPAAAGRRRMGGAAAAAGVVDDGRAGAGREAESPRRAGDQSRNERG